MKIDKNQDTDVPLRLRFAQQLLAAHLSTNRNVIKDEGLVPGYFLYLADMLIEAHNQTFESRPPVPPTPESETKAPDGPG